MTVETRRAEMTTLDPPHTASSGWRPLSREDLQNGSVRQAYLRTELSDLVLSEEAMQRSLAETVARAPQADVWVFAYGSLIWNPIFPVAETRLATVHGLHRSFCLWSRIGRGTRDNPGLVLGLDAGGACRGLALRIAAHHARDELDLLWRREMVTGAYVPTWVRARTPDGTVGAIAFVMNRDSHAYAGRLPAEVAARSIRTAAGLNGPCIDYLTQTASGLAAHGIRDRRLERLVSLCAAPPA